MRGFQGNNFSYNSLFSKNGPVFHKSALEIFKDRADPRRAFWARYNEVETEIKLGLPQNRNQIIFFSGEAGIGKTTLLNKLVKELEEKEKEKKIKKAYYTKFDFRNFAGTKRDIISKLAYDLQNKYEFSFPLTEFATTRISIERGGASIASKTLSERISSNKGLGLLNLIFKISPFGNLADLSIDAISYLEGSYNKNIFNEFKKVSESKEVKCLLNEIKKADIQQLEDMLHVFFAFDLKTCCSTLTEPLVIMLDTYEHFINPLGCPDSYKTKDLWLRNSNDGIVDKIPGIIWVMAGRHQIVNLTDYYDVDSWNELGVETILLGPLPAEDARAYLTDVNITGPIQDYLITIAKGSPLFLDLCSRTYWSLPEKDRNCFDCYNNTINGAIERFYERLDRPMAQTAKILSLFNDGWTDEMISHIEKYLPEFDIAAYDLLKKNSYFIAFSETSSRYVMNENFQQVISQNVEKELEEKVSQIIIEYYADKVNYNKENTEYYIRLANASSRKILKYEDFNNLAESEVFDFIYNNNFEEADLLLSQYENTASYKEKSDKNLYASVTILRSYFNLKKQKKFDEENSTSNVLTQEKDQELAPDVLYLFLFVLGYGNYLKGEYTKANEYNRKNYSLALTLYGLKKQRTLLVIIQLIKDYIALGNDHMASIEGEKAYSISKDLLGENNDITLSVLELLAITYTNLGDNQKALETDQEIYKIRANKLGEYHLTSLSALFNIAEDLSLQGNHKEALRTMRKVYESRVLILGDVHPDVFSTLNKIGNEYSFLCNHDKALESLSKAYNGLTSILGEKHPLTIKAHLDIGIEYIQISLFVDAYKIFSNVYETCLNTFGDDNPITLNALHYLGVGYKEIGEKQKALEIFTKVYGKKSMALGASANSSMRELLCIRNIYYELQEAQKALDIDRQIYEIEISIHNEDHSAVIDTLQRIEKDFNLMPGQTSRITEIKDKIYQLMKKKHGKDHPATINALVDKYINIMDYDQAIEIRRAKYGDAVKQFSEESIEAITSLKELSNTYLRCEKYEDAEKTLKKIYEIKVKTLGEDHPETIKAYKNISDSYGYYDDSKKLLALLGEAYDMYSLCFGPNHIETLQVLQEIADTYKELGYYKKSIEYRKRIYNSYKSIFGETHPSTASVLFDMYEETYHIEGGFAALELLRKVYTVYCDKLGESNPLTIEVLECISTCDLVNYDETLRLKEQIYKIRERTLGANNRTTLLALYDIGEFYSEHNNIEKSISLKEIVFKKLIEHYGDDDADAVSISEELLSEYKETGNVEKALEIEDWINNTGEICESMAYNISNFDIDTPEIID